MAYIIPNEGEQYMLSAAFCTGAAVATTRLILYSGNPTLTGTMMASSLTAVSAGGISSYLIPISNWCIPFLSAGSAVISASASNALDAAGGFKFTCSAIAYTSCYGYWIHSLTGKALVVESFSDGPYILNNAGDSITITPYVKFGTGSGN